MDFSSSQLTPPVQQSLINSLRPLREGEESSGKCGEVMRRACDRVMCVLVEGEGVGEGEDRKLKRRKRGPRKKTKKRVK